MKISIHGFSPDKKFFPKDASYSEVWQAVADNKGRTVDKKGLLMISAAGVTRVYDEEPEDWWAGIMVRIRDAKSLNTLGRDSNGKLKLKSEHLGENKVGEICFFIANAKTGSGLLACYHNGPGLGYLKLACRNLFKKELIRKREELEQSGTATKEKYDNLKGGISLNRIVRKGTFKDLIKILSKIKVFEVKYSSVQRDDGLFKKTRGRALTEKESFAFPADCILTDDMAEEIYLDSLKDNVEDAAVEGKDDEGNGRRFSTDMARNKLLFGTEDYDELLSGLDLDIEGDWSPAILKSPVVNWLLRTAYDTPNRILLQNA